ncbi:MAG TPA: GDSL-type esterase/lipase family protein [Blastocatellia bacterium]|nr:GDSL-type esterase/lipase family protein [Blastocatellia bacterium]
MLKRLLLLFALCVTTPTLAQQSNPISVPPLATPVRFADAINAFLAEDKTNPPPKDAILFIGSSIFRNWKNLKDHMAPLPVFNRAFGGSRTSDILYYMDKVVLPYEPRIIVYYCGSNDVNAGEKAVAIVDRFQQFVARVRIRLPKTQIYYVSINRAPQKKERWDVVDTANKMIQDYCARNKAMGFIDVNTALFDKDGKPRQELYLPDNLHFKDAAYDEFTAIIKPIITKAWTTGKVPSK